MSWTGRKTVKIQIVDERRRVLNRCIVGLVRSKRPPARPRVGQKQAYELWRWCADLSIDHVRSELVQLLRRVGRVVPVYRPMSRHQNSVASMTVAPRRRLPKTANVVNAAMGITASAVMRLRKEVSGVEPAEIKDSNNCFSKAMFSAISSPSMR